MRDTPSTDRDMYSLPRGRTGRPRVAGPSFSVAALLFAALLLGALPACLPGQEEGGGEAAQDSAPVVTVEVLREAQKIPGLELTDEELRMMVEEGAPFADVNELRESYAALRGMAIGNATAPALLFRPLDPVEPPEDEEPRWSAPPLVQRPDDLEEVAFWPVSHLAQLLRTGQVSSVELTRMYLDRLARHDSTLHAVITLTRERALAKARQMDREMARGEIRGPLHGIPYGAKDLFAVEGYRTTWGAEPYREQTIDETATVIEKLDEAGAVLVAKLTLGALAWGDVWYGERTRNPWNAEQGSSGSSAGSGAAVAAGLVPFALGTETLGSIVSPATRTGVTGLRPSFGRVSRHGAMALSWSMDKVGPICRYAEDCALVFDAIRGPDGEDRTVVDRPFPYDADTELSELRIAYVQSAFEEDTTEAGAMDRETLDVLRGLGTELEPIELPELDVDAMGFILSAEAAAAFDELTRSNRDSLLVRQRAAAWPNVFRSSRFIPAVEYLQANRARTLLMQQMREALEGFDVYDSPSYGGENLLITNLTGHPCVVVPNGFPEEDSPKSITFCAPMWGEAAALEVARAYQQATDFEERRPEAYDPGVGR